MKFRNFTFIIAVIIYNYFFWKEDLGLNLFIFTLMLIASLFIMNKEAVRSLNVKISLGGTLVTAISLLIFNSLESKIAHFVSFFLLVAFIQESKFRSVIFAFIQSCTNFINVPYQIYLRKKNHLKKFPRIYFIFRIMRLSLIPLCIAIVFYTLYCLANPIFETYAVEYIDKLLRMINRFFVEFSITRILFLFLGILLLSVVFFRNEFSIFLQKDMSFSEKLSRIRKSRKKRQLPFSSITGSPVYPASNPPFKSLALRNQNKRGIILLLMLNFLLLLENLIDIKWLWFGFTLPEGFSLQHYVRVGTGFLIASLILSMILLLYYFRKNQNFYQKNRALKLLSYIWIFQNIILCFSVFLRNHHYIDFHGLAYKRIGVYVFLSLCVFGLLTMLIKIKEIKSTYYLLRMNTWALYIAIVLLSCFNWDVNIASYNLAHWNKGEIDVDFYLKLSDKALPVIYDNLDKVKEQIETHKNNKVRWIKSLDFDKFVFQLNANKEYFIRKYNHSWLSYNIPDRNAFNELTKKQLVEIK